MTGPLLSVRTILLFAAALTLWAQTDRIQNPKPTPPPPPVDTSKSDPVSKTGPVSAVPEPELACAGNRSELLDFPNKARTVHLDASVLADLTITPEGKLKDLKFTTKTNDPDSAKLFEDVVRQYLAQSDFPPGCDKEPKQLRFEFFYKGDPAPERKTLVEFKTPNIFMISVNPDLPSNTKSADRSK